MCMSGSIHLFRVRGIALRMHLTFPLILIWAALQFGWLNGRGWAGAAYGVIVTLLLFVIVVLHELGHSVAAMRYGVEVKQIVLLPIGGVAQLARMPEDPRQELVIAIAGPAVNFLLAGLLLAMGSLWGQDLGVRRLMFALGGLGRPTLRAVFTYVFAANLFLAAFNLLPAFPMDGGRVLRALLASWMDHGRATTIAVTVGQGMAWLLGLWGFLGGGIFLILVAIFIYVGAAQEGRMVQWRMALSGLTVAQAYSRQVQALPPQATLRDAVSLTLNTMQSDFPICEGERLLGLLTHAALVEALDRHGAETEVALVMRREVEPVAPDEGLERVQERLAREKLDALPVVEEGLFLGLITSRDLNEVFRLLASHPDLVVRREEPTRTSPS